jgi:hypothetical protein
MQDEEGSRCEYFCIGHNVHEGSLASSTREVLSEREMVYPEQRLLPKNGIKVIFALIGFDGEEMCALTGFEGEMAGSDTVSLLLWVNVPYPVTGVLEAAALDEAAPLEAACDEIKRLGSIRNCSKLSNANTP